MKLANTLLKNQCWLAAYPRRNPKMVAILNGGLFNEQIKYTRYSDF